MSASESREGRELSWLTPRVRAKPRFPRWAGYGWLAAVVLSVPIPSSWGGVGGILKLVGLAAACASSAWLEELVFVWLAGRSKLARVGGALALPLAFLTAMPVGVVVGTPFAAIGDDGSVALTLAVAAIWGASAAAGSLAVVMIDVVVSALVQSFRARIQLAVLSLVGLASIVAGALALFASNLGEVVRWRPDFMRVNVQGERLDDPELARLLADPDLMRLIALLATVVFVSLSLPAVMSACGKLADAVMERMHPLAVAFESVGEGALNVRVEEAGSRDFRLLNRAFNHMVEQLSLSRNMERAFGQYVSGQVLSRIREQHGQANLPAELREASVFFADVRGFTSMSEALEPAEVLSVLNRYFERVVAVIDRHEGYLDKFVGDAVVVVFNGPIDQPDHAERAARCAIALQEEVARLNAARAFPEVDRLEIGVGVATGLLVAGNLGSLQHMEYTVIGDTVNLAARLTGRAPAGEVWVNARNAELLPPDVAHERLEPFSVKGKAQPVVAHRIWPAPSGSLT